MSPKAKEKATCIEETGKRVSESRGVRGVWYINLFCRQIARLPNKVGQGRLLEKPATLRRSSACVRLYSCINIGARILRRICKPSTPTWTPTRTPTRTPFRPAVCFLQAHAGQMHVDLAGATEAGVHA